VLRVILLRAGLFIFFAASIWALLPLIAQRQLHLGSGGYGLLLGCVGVGAVGGAALLPRLRSWLSPGGQLTAGSLALAVVALVLGLVHVTAVVAVALVLGGMAWILSLSTLSSLYQLSLPQWVKARGMSFYLIVFQGGNALGSAVLGVVAGRIGLSPTLLLATAGLALGPLAGLRYRFRPLQPDELVPAGDWPEPQLTGDGAPPGPVLVTFEYHALPGREADLLAALEDARFARRRTGASSWRLWRDSRQENRILEQFVVASWDEHVRQRERVTKRDQERYAAIQALTDPARPPSVTHWLTALSRRARRAAVRQVRAEGFQTPGPPTNPS
jgi:MFS family permease